jgi:hypothetical protein
MAIKQGYIFSFLGHFIFLSRFFIMEFTFKNNPDRNMSNNIVKFIYNICFYCKA